MPEGWGSYRKERRINYKRHKETFGDDKNVYYLDCLMDALNMKLTILQLYLYKTEKRPEKVLKIIAPLRLKFLFEIH